MMDKFFVRAHVCARLQSGPMGPHLEFLATALIEQGYATSGIRRHLRAADAFGRWLAQQGLSIADADETTLARYIAGLGRRYPRSYPQGRLPNAAWGLTKLLGILRQHGVIAPRVPTTPATEVERWLRYFEHYLACVTGAAPGTRRYYLYFARKFLQARFGTAALDWAALTTQDLVEFVRQEAARLKPSACRRPVTALRALLRFLVMRGVIPAGLARAIPPIRPDS